MVVHLRSRTSRPFKILKTGKIHHTLGLFCHPTRPKTFNLVVNNFGSINVGKQNYDNLINILKKTLHVTIYWNGEIFYGTKLKWDYNNKTVNISIPNYVNKALAGLHHSLPIKPQYYPHLYNAPVYSHKCQLIIPTTTNKKLTPAQLKHCRVFCGFSTIMICPLTTPCKQPPAPSPPPF